MELDGLIYGNFYYNTGNPYGLIDLVGYTNVPDNLIIPSFVDYKYKMTKRNCYVETISNNAFKNCTKLKSVSIPSDYIGSGAFENCTSLHSITINCKNLSTKAFSGCTSLDSIYWAGNDAPNIEDDTFEESTCQNAKVYVPWSRMNSFKNDEIWSKFKHLKTIYPTANIGVTGNGRVNVDYSGQILKIANQDYVEEGCSAVVSIVPIKGYHLASLSVGGIDVTSQVKDNQFIINEVSESMSINATFEYTPNSIELSVSGNGYVICEQRQIGTTNNNRTLGNVRNSTSKFDVIEGFGLFFSIYPDEGNIISKVLENGTDITSQITNSIESSNIALNAKLEISFEEESNIISFEDISVKEICIANWDKNGSRSLSKEEAALVTDIGTVFNGNTSITSFDELKYFTGISTISSYAFKGCTNLERITFPTSLTSIEEGAFYEYRGLSGTLSLPNSLKTIGTNAFFRCTKLTGSLTIPNSVTSIGEGAFYQCTGFSGTLTLPESITSIGAAAFYDCRGLTGSLTIPNTVVTIEEGTFLGCSGFTGSLTIPNSVTSIENDAFRNCTGFTGPLIIPNSVKRINIYAFYGCSNINRVISQIQSPFEISNNVFEGISSDAILQIPHGTKSKYQEFSGWTVNFKEIVEETRSFTLSINASGNGTATFDGTTIRNKSISFTVNEGTSATITFAPDAGSRIAIVKLNDTEITSSVVNNKYTISNITADAKLAVTYETITHILSIASSGNGSATYNSIAISGKTQSFTVNEGTSATITFTPDNGYRIKSVKVNGSTVAVSNNKYTISSVTANTTVSVEFEAIPASIDITQYISATSIGGAITQTNNLINSGSQLNWTFSNKSTQSVTLNSLQLIDGQFGTAGNKMSVNQVVEANSSVSYSTTIGAEGIHIPVTCRFGYSYNGNDYSTDAVYNDSQDYTLSIKVKGNGQVQYNGNTIRNTTESYSVAFLSSVKLVIKPDNGYQIKSVKLNNSDVTSRVSNNVLTIITIISNQSVEVEFEAIPITTYTLSITSLGNGFVSYSGNTISGTTQSYTVDKGTNVSLTFSPNSGYRLKGVVVNGTDVTSDVTNNQYTINNFNQNTSVEATFEKEEIIPTYREAGIKVDLGLSVLWADRNVGANSVTATGDYFAWGDTIARFSYDSNSYIYMMTDGEYKKIGDIICGNREYDAATLQWGGEWRMPTDTELQELIDNCTWTYVLRNGVYGYEVAGRNGNAIFLPVTGYMRGQTKELSSTYSYYWSGVVSYERPVSGKAVKFAPEEQSEMTRVYRYLGLCLRPVYGPVPAYFSLSISSTGNGTVTYLDNKISGKTQSFYINEGGSATLAIAPSDGYRLKSVVVNGVDVTANVENDQYIINNVSRNTTVKVEFEAIPPIFSLVITATGNGSVTYNGTAIRSRTSTFNVEEGASVTLVITPDNDYRIKSVLVNGVDVTSSVANNQYTINNIQENTTVEVEFEAIPPTTYSLSITAIGNGSVSYNGTTVRGNTNTLSVVEGTSATITITPDNGYRVKSVKVNGSDVTSLVSGNQYAVSNISKNTTIEVVFEKIPQTYSLTITASGNGYVNYLEASIAFSNSTKEFTITEGSTATLTFTPNNGYRLKSVAVNGTDVTSVVANNRYAISNINKNTTVTVTFEEIPPTTYWLTITAKGNGSVKCEIDNTSSSISSSTKSISVVEGKRVKLTFTPNSGYRVVSIKVNGTVIESNLNSYSISAFNQNTTVEVEFEEIPPATYTLTISSTVGGYVAYAGNTIHETTWNYSVVKGTSVTLTFTPNNGYRLKSVVVNGTDVTANVVNNQYTINNISRSTTIEVEFEEIPLTTYTLSITAEGNGYVTYVEKSIAFNKTTKEFTVTEGSDVTLAFSPMSGYRVKSVVVNGTNVTTSISNNRYAISNINKNTSVIVSFEEIPPTTYSLTITAVGNGYASYNGTNVRGTSSVFTVVEGTSATITFVPDVGYRIKSVSVNGEDVTASITNQYTISSISRDMTIEVVFEVIPPKTYTLSITAEGNGSVSYLEASASFSGTTKEFTITEESSATLTFTPNDGYRLKSVVVNGTDVTANVVNNQYTINNFSRNTTVVVTFEEIPPTIYALSITATGNGSVGYNGTTIRNKTSNLKVVEGSNVTIVVTPDDGNRIKSVAVNGIDVTSSLTSNQYTISNVNTDTTIKVEFFEELKRMTYADVNYKVVSYDEKTVKVEAGNYSRVLIVPSSFSYQGQTWKVIGIEDDALAGSPNLAAIIWKPNCMFTATVTNPNLLLYVESATYAPNTVKNVVVNGVANSITLAEAADGNDFYCPQSFTAKTISYTHNYMMTTGIDECQGWETLALPFDVQIISHSVKGTIVPFATWNNGGAYRPFWLYELSESGWKAAQSVRSNTPYVISMPNNEWYNSAACLNGIVTFSAENVTVDKTEVNTVRYNGKSFVPNYANQAANGEIYALNVSNYWESNNTYMKPGSEFVRNMRTVHPFEAYMTTTNGSRMSFGIFEETPTEIRGIIDQLRNAGTVSVYNLNGQKMKAKDGITTVDDMKCSLPAGVYIIDGQKTIIKK